MEPVARVARGDLQLSLLRDTLIGTVSNRSLTCRQPVNTEDNTLSKYEAVTKADHILPCLILRPVSHCKYRSLTCRQPVNTEDNTLSKYEAVTNADHRLHFKGRETERGCPIESCLPIFISTCLKSASHLVLLI